MSDYSVIIKPESVVRVDGVVVPHDDVRISGAIAQEDVIVTAGLSGIDCSITWSSGLGVVAHPDHPWLPGFKFAPGKRVTVDLVWPDKTSRRFTGTITSTHVDLGTGTITSQCVDDTALLDVQGSVPPLAYVMPPAVRDGARRYVGMSSMFITGHLLRQAGFTAVAPTQPECVVFIPMDGTMWATVGRTVAAYSTARGANFAPYYRETEWGGIAMENPYVRAVGDLAGTSGLPISLVVDLGDLQSGADVAVITATNSSGDGIGLEIDGDELHMLTVSSGTPTQRGTLTRAASTTRVQVSYDPTGSGSLEMFLDRLAAGESVPLWSGTVPVDFTEVTVTVDATLATIGAVQVFRSLTSVVSAPRTVRFRRDAYTMATNAGGIGAVPYIKDRSVLDVLTEQARCEWVDLWVDESGVAQVCDRDELESQAPVKVATDGRLEGLLDLPSNGFATMPDGTPVPGRPYPEGNTGITALSNTTDGYVTAWDGPFLALANSGSSATAGQRGVVMNVPIRPGEYNTFYAETRSPTGVAGMLRARYYNASNQPVIGTSTITGEYGGGTMDWTLVQVKLPRAPAGAAYARVEAVNGTPMAGGSPAQELHFRNFTTYGPGVAVMSLAARTSGLGSYGRVVVNRRAVSVETRKRPTLPFWDAGKENILAGEEYLRFASPISPGEGTERHWLADAIDTSVEYAGAATDYPLNMREGTIVGGQYVDDDDVSIGWVTADYWPIDVEFLDYDRVMISGVVNETLPDDATQVVTIPYQGSPTVSDARKQESTVVVKGYGWETVIPGSPVIRELTTTGPDYIHDGDWWLQSDYQANLVADKVEEWVSNPRPVIDSLEIPLVDINRGDRIIVHLTNVAGVTLDVKVIGIEENHGDGTMRLTAQILDVEAAGMTFDQMTDVDEFLSA